MANRKPHPTTKKQPRVKSRSDLLLEKCAAAFLDCRDPLSHEFLVENSVTADECFNLSARMGHIINGFLNSPREMQNALLVVSVTEGVLPADSVYSVATQDLLLRELEGL